MEKSFEVTGVKGLKSTAFRKTFKTVAAYERWLDANEGNVTIYATRPAD